MGSFIGSVTRGESEWRGHGSLLVTTCTAETGSRPVTLSYQLPQQPHPPLGFQESEVAVPSDPWGWTELETRTESDSVENRPSQSSKTMRYQPPAPQFCWFLSLTQQVFKLPTPCNARTHTHTHMTWQRRDGL